MEDGIDDINKQIKEGKIVVTDEKILDTQTEKQEYVDATTAPTMTTRFITLSKKFQEQKGKPKE